MKPSDNQMEHCQMSDTINPEVVTDYELET